MMGVSCVRRPRDAVRGDRERETVTEQAKGIRPLHILIQLHVRTATVQVLHRTARESHQHVTLQHVNSSHAPGSSQCAVYGAGYAPTGGPDWSVCSQSIHNLPGLLWRAEPSRRGRRPASASVAATSSSSPSSSSAAAVAVRHAVELS